MSRNEPIFAIETVPTQPFPCTSVRSSVSDWPESVPVPVRCTLGAALVSARALVATWSAVSPASGPALAAPDGVAAGAVADDVPGLADVAELPGLADEPQAAVPTASAAVTNAAAIRRGELRIVCSAQNPYLLPSMT